MFSKTIYIVILKIRVVGTLRCNLRSNAIQIFLTKGLPASVTSIA